MNTVGHFFAFVVSFDKTTLTETVIRAVSVQTSSIGVTLMRSQFTLVFVFYTSILIKVVAIAAITLETARSVDAISVIATMSHIFGALVDLLAVKYVSSITGLAQATIRPVSI